MNLKEIPKRDWKKKLAFEWEYEGKKLKVYTVEPQSHLIAVTKPVGLLEGYTADAVLVKAFEKNYKTSANPKVVSNYGFEQQHGEPIELIDFVFECIFDRACEAEMNRYRHNSKNYESGRYVDYTKHGLTVIPPLGLSDVEQARFVKSVVKDDFEYYVDLLKKGFKKQDARRVFGTYLAVESVYKTNLRSLWHMARQRSATLSPNGKEAEPQISSVVTQMVEKAAKYIPVFAQDLVKQIGKGYR